MKMYLAVVLAGTRQTGLPVDQWQGLFERWLRSRGLIAAQR